MSSIARPLQQKLAERFVIGRPEAARGADQRGRDPEIPVPLPRRAGGRDGLHPRPAEDRGAVCISSQVGCTLSCRFCHTGTQTLVRNLGAAEIVGQFMAARDAYGEWPSPKGETPRLLSTIVLMGMGEPLYNYANVAKAMTIVMDDEGIGLSRRRITLSTSGVVPMMDRAGAELGVNLAVSLHAVRDELRDELVPLNRKYPIAELIAACRRYPGASNARRITFEYVMLKGVNDSRGRRARTGAADRRHAGQGEPDPVQSLARQSVRDQQQQRDRPLRADRHGRRVCLAGPDAARAGHPGGVRAAADREPEGAGWRIGCLRFTASCSRSIQTADLDAA